LLDICDENGKVRTMELTPATARTFFRIYGSRPIVETKHQHAGRTELDAQSTTFAPVIKNVNLAPGQTPALGTRSIPGL
jgi:hypothetical protein